MSTPAAAQHVGPRIKELREAAGETQDDLGSKIGVTKGTISLLENEKYSPRMDLAAELAGVYGLSLEELLDDRSWKARVRELATLRASA
jgi:putative transcriptional regulator